MGFAGAIVCFVARASPLQAAFQMMRLQRKARSGCQRDAGRSWAVGREEVGDGSRCCGLDGGGAVVVVLSLAREVRWGIRSYSSVRVGGCAPLEIFGASCSGFDSATLHQCGLWPRQHPSGLAQAVGHPSRQCSAARILCRCCLYSSNRYMAYAPIGLASTRTVLYLACRLPPVTTHTICRILSQELILGT